MQQNVDIRSSKNSRLQQNTEAAVRLPTQQLLRNPLWGRDPPVGNHWSKAFDTVNHNILFDKFYHNFGIREIPLQLFRSYLSNRKQFAKFENVQSGLVDILNGVPQGSVLGPLLFIMYINDLPKSSVLQVRVTCIFEQYLESTGYFVTETCSRSA